MNLWRVQRQKWKFLWIENDCFSSNVVTASSLKENKGHFQGVGRYWHDVKAKDEAETSLNLWRVKRKKWKFLRIQTGCFGSNVVTASSFKANRGQVQGVGRCWHNVKAKDEAETSLNLWRAKRKKWKFLRIQTECLGSNVVSESSSKANTDHVHGVGRCSHDLQAKVEA